MDAADSPWLMFPELPSTGKRAEAARLADAARRIIDRLASVEFDEVELAQAASALEDVAGALEAAGHPRQFYGFAEAANSGDAHAFFDQSPIMGVANPLAAPIFMEVDEQVVRGRATYGAAYEGPPGCVHGGILAAAFDEILGSAQSMTGSPGMTGTLTVKYRNPTPLHQELTFAGWVDRVEGRKIFTKGTCHAGEMLTAEADGIFISVDFMRFASLLADREA